MVLGICAKTIFPDKGVFKNASQMQNQQGYHAPAQVFVNLLKRFVHVLLVFDVREG